MTEYRRFIGTAYLEKTSSINEPTIEFPYLRRNLRLALDRQNHDLLLERGHAPASELTKINDNRRLAKWELPSSKMFNELAEGLEPVIRIGKITLRHATSAQVKPSRHRKRHGRAGSPDWLPAENEWKVPCQVSVRILYQTVPKSTVHHSLQKGHILRHDHPTKDPAYEVVLEKPLEIKLARLEVMVEYKDSEGNNKWKWARDDGGLTMDFRIQCNGSEDSADLLSQLEHMDVSEFADMLSDEGQIRCYWRGLPDLPASGRLLDLRRSRKKKIKEMRYKAEVSMVWSHECQPLVAWNRTCQIRNEESRQLPTPSISDDSERPRKMRILYMNRRGDFRSLTAAESGLYCVVSSCKGHAEHSSMERLMLHYAIHHDHMKFEIDPRSDQKSTVISVSPDEDALANVSSQKEHFEWQAPKSAFDVDAYLKGAKTWAVREYKSKEKSTNTPQKSPRKRGHGGQAAQSLHAPRSPIRSRPKVRKPEDVPDLPEVKRKKRIVTPVEGVSFYRTLSKKQVSAGEEISDSEVEANMDWHIPSRRHEQTVLGIDGTTQDFNEVFDRHLDYESPMSDLYVQEAIVRFARKYARRLSESKWKEQFRTKLEQFEDKNIIDARTVAYCQKLVTTPVKAAVETVREITPSGRSSQALSGKGRFVRRGGGSEHRTPERGRAMSPPSHLSTKSRMRWRDGGISQEEKDAADKASPTPTGQRLEMTPLGRRKVMCRKGGKTTGPHHISDFLRDDKRDISRDDIQPAELELTKLKRLLDNDLGLIRDADIIVCISNGTASPIVDDFDWYNVLQEIQTKGSEGDIVFELQPRHAFEGLLKDNSNAAKRKCGDEDGPLKRKKVRIQENLCICGSKPEGMRGTLACGNPKCSRQFHLGCLDFQQRPAFGWLCVDCR